MRCEFINLNLDASTFSLGKNPEKGFLLILCMYGLNVRKGGRDGLD